MKAALRLLLAPYRFSVDRLFRMGEVGWHWQFDDPLKRVGIPYEWVDTAGTTPTTAVGQGIGLLLGREYGGATGPSLLANGTTGLTGTATAASYNTSTGAGSVSRAVDASNQSWVSWTGLTTSSIHRMRITNTGATSLDVRNGSVSGTIVASIAAGATSYVHPLTSGGSTSITITATNNSTTATFTVLEFGRVPGTHLIQATSTARPTLSARVNLLLNTEQFDNAYWTKEPAGTGTAPVVTANAGTDPLGGSTADRVVCARGAGTTTGDYSLVYASATGIVSGTSYLGSVWMKSNTGATQTVCLYLAASTSAVVSQTVGTTWTRVPVLLTAGATGISFVFGSRGGAGFTSDQNLDILVWGADLRTADDAAKNIPAYQRVGATAADHDTDGFPHYAEGDGTDNYWASVATVDGSATDKVTVVAAVTKNSDAAVGVVLEHTVSLATQDGSFGLSAPDTIATPNYGVYTRGVTASTGFVATTFAAPVTSVIDASIDNSGAARATQIFPRVNGAIPTLTGAGSAAAGAGNFANATMYVLARAGTSLRFNGRFYGSTGRFGPMSDGARRALYDYWRAHCRLP